MIQVDTRPPLAALIMVVAVLALTGARAAAYEFTSGDLAVTPFISDRARVEVVDWFDPGSAAAPNDNHDYAFFANVIRFGGKLTHPHFRIVVEGQDVALVGLPDDARGLGPGSVYFANTKDRDQRELHLRQGYLALPNLFTEGLTLKGGRFAFTEGRETKAADPNLDWLKRIRIPARLVGSFDYTHVGRSFDGGLVSYDRGPMNFTLMGGLPTAGGFNISANKDIPDVNTIYAAATVTEPEWLPRSDIRLFYIYYHDGRALTATDNRAADVRAADDHDIDIHTIGGNFAKVFAAGPGNVDLLLWVAGQFGDWESQDHGAYGLALETGYRLNDTPWKPWFRIGYFRSSGDDDPGDGDHDTFFQILPTARLYALTPFFNLMNNQDLFFHVILKPLSNLLVRSDYHYLRVTEDDDLVYAGGGATQRRPIFGYAGFPAAGDDSVAHLVDLTLVYTVNEHLKFWTYYGHAFGQSVVSNKFPAGHDLDYFYFETTVTF